jgi:hypothetical protein
MNRVIGIKFIVYQHDREEKNQSRFAADQERQGSFYKKNQSTLPWRINLSCQDRSVWDRFILASEIYTSLSHFTCLSQCNSMQKIHKNFERICM